MGTPTDPNFLYQHVEQYFECVRNSWGGSHILHGMQPTPDDVVLMSNDYLAIANDLRIIKAETQVLQDVGHGTPQSRVFNNHLDDSHRKFELRIANVLGTEDAVLCQSGYDANLGIVEAFATSSAPVYIDVFAHASLWKGCASAGVKPIPFQHNNIKHLSQQIEKSGPGIVIVDAVYSTNGSLCPLSEMVALVNTHGCAIIVDETHSFGVQGACGEGITKSLGLNADVHFQIVGLSKTFASRGGIVAGSKRNMEFFRYRSFPAIFSTQVMVHEVAGYDMALSIIQGASQRRRIVHERHKQFRNGLSDIGYNVSESQTQIVAIESGSDKETIRFRDYIQSRGLFGSVFCWPATPKNRALIRFTLNAAVTPTQIDKALSILSDAFTDMGAKDWKSTRRVKTVKGS